MKEFCYKDLMNKDDTICKQQSKPPFFLHRIATSNKQSINNDT